MFTESQKLTPVVIKDTSADKSVELVSNGDYAEVLKFFRNQHFSEKSESLSFHFKYLDYPNLSNYGEKSGRSLFCL